MKNAISASAVDSRQARGSAYPGAGEERIPMGQKPGDLDGLVIATSGRDRWCSGRAAEEELGIKTTFAGSKTKVFDTPIGLRPFLRQPGVLTPTVPCN